MTRFVRSSVFVAGLFAISVMRADSPHDSARAFLRETFRLSQAEINHLDVGHVVSRTLDTTHAREVATLGIVRIETTPEKYVERLADIATFKRTEDVLQIGTFSDPAQISDVAALTLEEGDLRRLRTCRVDDCGIRISAKAIHQFAHAVDWRAADATQRATSMMRQLLVDYVTGYRMAGAAALMEYANTSPRLALAVEFASLVDSDQASWQYLGDLREHLLKYPANHGGGVDLIYWSKERVYKRAVISATHLAITRQADHSPMRFAIASKQIYAMHYFDASLGLTLLLPDRSSSSPATFVVYLNRSRIDLFDGVFGGLARRIVSGRARSLVSEQLARLQRTLGT